jgi:hypothetical protein
MKALPPPPSQLELWNKGRALAVVENTERKDVLRALAEILLVAADATLAAQEVVDEAR